MGPTLSRVVIRRLFPFLGVSLVLQDTSESYSELAELAGGFIHDIKNHLSTFALNLQLLSEDFQSPQTPCERRAHTRIERLQNQCQRLVDLSNDFLRFASVQHLNLTSNHLNEVIEEMIDFFLPTATVANIDVRSFVSHDLPMVSIDRELFKQVLLNMMINAEQAMPDGGKILFQAQSIGSHIELSVIDTGKGVAPEHLEKLFKPFFTTKAGGTGLGLATARRILEVQGGSIDVQSELGHGTCFRLRLPIVS